MSASSLSDAASDLSQDSNTSQDSHTSLGGEVTDVGNIVHNNGPSPQEFLSNCGAPMHEALALIRSHRSLTHCLTRLFEELEQGQWIVTQWEDSASIGHVTLSKPGQSSGVRYMVSWLATLSAVADSELRVMQKQHCSTADIAAKRLDLLKNGGHSYWRLQVYDDHLRTFWWITDCKWGNPPVSSTMYDITDGQASVDLCIGLEPPVGTAVDGNGQEIANPLNWLPQPLNGPQEDWQELLEGLTVSNRFDKHRKSNLTSPWSASLESSGYAWSPEMRRMLNGVAEYDSITSAYKAANELAFARPHRGSRPGHYAEVEMCTTDAKAREAHKKFEYQHTRGEGERPETPTDSETMAQGVCTRLTMSEIGWEDVEGEHEPFKFNWDTTWKWVPEQSWQSTYTITCGKASVMVSCKVDGTVQAAAWDSDGKVVENPAQSLPLPGRGRDEFWDFSGP